MHFLLKYKREYNHGKLYQLIYLRLD